MHVNTETYLASSAGIGLNVIIHEPFSNPRINEEAIAITPGFEVRIGLEKHVIKDLPKPYSEVDCIGETDSFELEFGFNSRYEKYTWENCLEDCMTFHINEQCNCSVEINGSDACTMYDYYSCIYYEQYGYYEKCNCRKACEQTAYDYELTTLQLPTPHFAEQLNSSPDNNKTVEEIRANIIVLNVFYPSLHYTVTEQVEAFTFDELISNIGGQLGLFLGASIMTVVEVLEGLTFMAWAPCKRKLSKKRKVDINWKN